MSPPSLPSPLGSPMPRALLVLLLTGLAGCDSATDSEVAVGTATLVDSIVLQEPDSVALGTRTPVLLRTRDGAMFTFEFPGRRVSAYAPDGRYLGELARSGDGPGALRMVGGGAVMPGDSAVVVFDAARLRVLSFGASDLTLRRETSLAEPFLAPNSGAMLGDDVLLAPFVSPTAFARLDGVSGVIQPWGETPKDWSARNLAAFSRAVAVPVGERVFTLLPLDSIALWRDKAGAVLDSIRVPARARRPVTADVRERLERMVQSDSFEQVASWSLASTRLSGDRPAVLFLDLDAAALEGGMRFDVRWHQFYVTVLGNSPATTCVDIPVNVPFGEMSWPTFTGDTLWVLDRTPADDGTPRTMVRGLRISCER